MRFTDKDDDDSIFSSLLGFLLGCVSAIFLYLAAITYDRETPNLLIMVSVLTGALSLIIGLAYMSLHKAKSNTFSRLSFLGVILSSVALVYFALNTFGVLDKIIAIFMSSYDVLARWAIIISIIGIFFALLFIEEKWIYSER